MWAARLDPAETRLIKLLEKVTTVLQGGASGAGRVATVQPRPSGYVANRFQDAPFQAAPPGTKPSQTGVVETGLSRLMREGGLTEVLGNFNEGGVHVCIGVVSPDWLARAAQHPGTAIIIAQGSKAVGHGFTSFAARELGEATQVDRFRGTSEQVNAWYERHEQELAHLDVDERAGSAPGERVLFETRAWPGFAAELQAHPEGLTPGELFEQPRSGQATLLHAVTFHTPPAVISQAMADAVTLTQERGLDTLATVALGSSMLSGGWGSTEASVRELANAALGRGDQGGAPVHVLIAVLPDARDEASLAVQELLSQHPERIP